MMILITKRKKKIIIIILLLFVLLLFEKAMLLFKMEPIVLLVNQLFKLLKLGELKLLMLFVTGTIYINIIIVYELLYQLKYLKI